MYHHIQPQSVEAYLSSIISQLELHLPNGQHSRHSMLSSKLRLEPRLCREGSLQSSYHALQWPSLGPISLSLFNKKRQAHGTKTIRLWSSMCKFGLTYFLSLPATALVRTFISICVCLSGFRVMAILQPGLGSLAGLINSSLPRSLVILYGP